ncbi:MAG: Ti-type conjugative transfer relaxase TraA [Sphingomonas sp. 28-66-16]|nr:MAG: Ti-type conjugative transfer relaxase TraA [Sphingomonas sp. 28-66-16]
MAIYHFSAKVIGRASGSSALASAAYRSASRLYDERLGRTHDFTNKAGVVHSEVMLPDGAPEGLGDRSTLWNEVESAEVRRDAQLAREIEFAIPREMTKEQGIALARDFVRQEFVARGMIADVNVHWDKGADGEPKPHAHVMLTMREVGEGRFGAKVRDWNRTDLLEHWRGAWATHANARMAELGIEARIDHRSFEAQGIELEPQHKIGPAGARRLDRGDEAERAADHVDIARRNGAAIIARPEIGLDAITHQQSTFTVRDMARIAHRHSSDKEQFDQVLGAMRGSDQLVALGRDGTGQDRFTTRGMIEVELKLARSADVLERSGHSVAERHVERALASASDNGLVLSDEQQSALRHVTGARDLGLVVGYAGAGKSAMLGVARDAWEAQGYTVRGAALSGIAAENLEQGSGIASRTIASLEHQWARGREHLCARDVLVIDEAGMIGSRQMERLATAAADAGAKLVLVGDAQQLQAIEAGAAFRMLTERHGAREISEVRRQAEQWQRDATRALATGRTGGALARYAEAGMVHAADTRTDAASALIERWKEARDNNPAQRQTILAHTRDDVRMLNEMARNALKQSEQLDAEITVETARGGRLMAPGERIIFLKNDRDLDVKNGTLATIERLDPTQIEVRLDDGRRVGFDTKNYADIDHGYATTIHKAQGITVDRAHVLATPGLDAHSSYVALSRHRREVQLHYGRDDFMSPEQLARTLGRERAKDTALDYAQSRDRFVDERGYRSAHVPTAEQSGDQKERRRSPFAGLNLGRNNDQARGLTSDSFKGLQLGRATVEAGSRPAPLDRAVQAYAKSLQDIQAMERQGLKPLVWQRNAFAQARDALDGVRAGGHVDLSAAIVRDPALVAESASGRTARAIMAMQLEAEVRTNPEMRADRFVAQWRQLGEQRDRLSGWQQEEAREGVETRMRALAKGPAQDPALDRALVARRTELGLGPRQALEWSPGSRTGDIGRELASPVRGQSVAQALVETLGKGRSRDVGHSL